MARTSAADRAAARSEPSTPDRNPTTISPGTAAGAVAAAERNVGPLCAAATGIPGSTQAATTTAVAAPARLVVAPTPRASIRTLIGSLRSSAPAVPATASDQPATTVGRPSRVFGSAAERTATCATCPLLIEDDCHG